MSMISQNPATLEILKTFEEDSEKQIEKKLCNSEKAFKLWKKKSYKSRSKYLLRVAEVLRESKKDLAKLITLEMGKTLIAAEGEIEKCAMVCEYYANNTKKILRNEKINTDASKSFVTFNPLGIVLAIMPWNFPFWQVFRFASPALMAGNVGVLKHASNNPQCALAIEKVFIDAGLPTGVFQTLMIGSSRVESIIRDTRIGAITLTGSEKAGSMVARVAGEELKKCVLELGGSDPFIVLKDADIDMAAKTAVLTRMQNNAGQSCIAAKRFIVESAIEDEFIRKVKEELMKLKVGDPMDENTNVGPLATEQILNDIESQVDKSVDMGVTVVYGGKRLDMKGYYYMPTLLANVTKGMPVYDEEVFGPVISVIIVENEQEAIRVANDSQYGLASSLFTNDLKKAKKIIPLIEAGNVFVNGQVKSDPRLPFGGIKKSGYGRELSSYGIKEFVNIKSVWIK